MATDARRWLAEEGAAWAEVSHIATNVPFRLEAWKRGESLILVRNPQYHGRFTGNLERVELTWLASEKASARLEAYEADGLDVLELGDIPTVSERDRARQRHAGEYVLAPLLTTFYAGLNVNQPPLDDVRVRRAFSLATDRETVANVALGGYVSSATGGFIPPGMPGHSAGIALPYDPEQERQLLAEAGYPGGRGFPVVDALMTRCRVPKWEYLQSQWRENLGVEIAWQVMQPATWQDRVNSDPPHLFGVGWKADYPDPDSFLRGCPGRRNAGWQNDRYEALVEEARRITDQEDEDEAVPAG